MTINIRSLFDKFEKDVLGVDKGAENMLQLMRIVLNNSYPDLETKQLNTTGYQQNNAPYQGNTNTPQQNNTPYQTNTNTPQQSTSAPQSDPNTRLYVDGCMNKYTGDKALGFISSHDSKDVLSLIESKFPQLLKGFTLTSIETPKGVKRAIETKFTGIEQQNHGAELLSLVAALRVVTNVPGFTEIYSDSKLLVMYWSKGFIKNDTKKAMDPLKLASLNECIELRKKFETQGGRVRGIDSDTNPADPGWHKRSYGGAREQWW